jgi:hypothetical protein
MAESNGKCPKCGSTNIKPSEFFKIDGLLVCVDCENYWMAPQQTEISRLTARVSELEGMKPEPLQIIISLPEGETLPRYGVRWNGPTSPMAIRMDDGYWTPWHISQAEIDRLHTRLEDNFVFDSDGNKVPVHIGTIPDGIETRDDLLAHLEEKMPKFLAALKAKDEEFVAYKTENDFMVNVQVKKYGQDAINLRAELATLKANLKDQASDYVRDTEEYLDEIATLKAQLAAAEKVIEIAQTYNTSIKLNHDYCISPAIYGCADFVLRAVESYHATYGKEVKDARP